VSNDRKKYLQNWCRKTKSSLLKSWQLINWLNKILSQKSSDCCWSILTRTLKYKAERDGKNYLETGSFFAPSSKSCHVGLNQVGSLPLEVRSWTCSNCKIKHDRDVNSAIIIGDEELGLLALGTSTTAHERNGSSTFGRKSSV